MHDGKRLATQQSVNGTIKSICDIMRRSNCAGALQYVPELAWIFFLRILDEREMYEAEEAEAVAMDYTPSLAPPMAGGIGLLRMDEPHIWQAKPAHASAFRRVFPSAARAG